MRTSSTIAATAALVLAMTGGAFAAEITVGTDLGVSAGAAGAAGSANLAGAAGAESTAKLMAAASTTDAEVSAISGASAATKVNVVMVSQAGADASGLATFKTEHQSDVEKLQAAIEANSALKSELEAKMVKVDQIVAADVAADGMIILYELG